MFKQTSRTLLPALVVVLGLMGSAGMAHAQSTAEGENPFDTHAITSAINASTTKIIDEKRVIFDYFGQRIGTAMQAVSQTLLVLFRWENTTNKDVMPYYDSLLNVITERVLSRVGAGGVNAKLDQVMQDMVAGHTTVENISAGSSENPYAEADQLAETKLYEILTTTFCDPDSTISTTACQNSKAEVKSNQNFVDMFLGERTWTDKTVLDALLLARRFFAPSSSRDVMGVFNEQGFIANRSAIAQSNLRMSILNELAARRAPTSIATNSVLRFMFNIFANATPFVATVDPAKACSADALVIKDGDADDVRANKFLNGYVCSYTNTPSGGSERIISQAAIDRIMQYDFYMSADFYGRINSADYNNASLDRMNVFMKTQQLAQDYRQLRLLQMKVAGVAMNMMNGK